jgi:hypothetical protein
MFIREDLPESGGLQNHQDQMDPKHLLDKILACEHTELGKEIVDGVLCEGVQGEGRDKPFHKKLTVLSENHQRKPSLMTCLDKAGL